MVFKYESQTVINASDIWNGEDEIINVKVPYDAAANVIISPNNKTHISAIRNGMAMFTIHDLDIADYTVDALSECDYRYM